MCSSDLSKLKAENAKRRLIEGRAKLAWGLPSVGAWTKSKLKTALSVFSFQLSVINKTQLQNREFLRVCAFGEGDLKIQQSV